MWRHVYVRLRSLWCWRRQEAELDTEIRFHLAEEMEERIAAGMSPEEARAAARRDFGNVPLIRELTRETWGWGPAERLLQDVRSAFRGMRRNPGYTCAVVLTLSLGIGLNAAMYGMLSRLFLQAPPHIVDPDGIHRVWVREGDRGDRTRLHDNVRWGEFTALRTRPLPPDNRPLRELRDAELLPRGGTRHPRRARLHRARPRGRAEGRGRQRASRRRGLAGQRAVGRCLFPGEASDCTTVVGVAESALEFGLRDTNRVPHYYVPLDQAAADPESAEYVRRNRSLVVRTQGDPGRTAPPVLAALAELFPDLPGRSVRSLPAVHAGRIRSWTIGTGLFGAAALLALLLAALGLYAVIAFGVRQRELEFGIRRALGAQAWDLLRLVLVRGLSLAVAGVAAGALAALWAGRFVAPLLFEGRSPRDPLALTTAAVVLVTVALAASFLPARRAAQADPRQAMQAE